MLRLDTREHDRDALALEARDRVCEHGRPGRVDDGDPLAMRRTTTRTSLTLARLQKEVVGGREEQRAVHPVGHDDVLVEQRSLLVAVVASSGTWSMRAARDACRSAKKPATTRPTSTQPPAEVHGEHRGQCGHDQHRCVAAQVERIRAPRLEKRTICTAVAMSTPASAATGIMPTWAATSTTMSRTTAWLTEASREAAPSGR